MRFKHRNLAPLVEMEMTPLIDVVFQLLIFFMLTSAFVFQPGVKVRLPRSVTSDVIHQENLVISISAKDLIYFGSELVTLKELRERFRARGASVRPVLIRSDIRTSMGRVVEVWDLCRSLGISQVNLATSTAEAPGS